MDSQATSKDNDIDFALRQIEEGAKIRVVARTLGIAESILRSRRDQVLKGANG